MPIISQQDSYNGVDFRHEIRREETEVKICGTSRTPLPTMDIVHGFLRKMTLFLTFWNNNFEKHVKPCYCFQIPTHNV